MLPNQQKESLRLKTFSSFLSLFTTPGIVLDALKMLADCLQEKKMEGGREKPQKEEREIRQQNNGFRFEQVTIFLQLPHSVLAPKMTVVRPRETVLKCGAGQETQACHSSSKRPKVRRKKESDGEEKREEARREAELCL